MKKRNKIVLWTVVFLMFLLLTIVWYQNPRIVRVVEPKISKEAAENMAFYHFKSALYKALIESDLDRDSLLSLKGWVEDSLRFFIDSGENDLMLEYYVLIDCGGMIGCNDRVFAYEVSYDGKLSPKGVEEEIKDFIEDYKKEVENIGKNVEEKMKELFAEIKARRINPQIREYVRIDEQDKEICYIGKEDSKTGKVLYEERVKCKDII